MVITDKFVFIHLPKTGGTFVQSMIKSAYHGLERFDKLRMRFNIYYFNKLFLDGTYDNSTVQLGQHGRVVDIPAKWRNKPVLSVARDPFTWYLSLYEFQWWYKHPRISESYSYEDHPSYPELTFTEFYRNLDNVSDTLMGGKRYSYPVGHYAYHYILYFFRDPEAVLEKMDDEYIESGAFRQDMYPVEFIRTEDLNNELYAYMRNLGYADYRINRILHSKKIYPQGKGKGSHKLKDHYTPEIVEDILRRDRLVFKLFEEYDKNPLTT